MIIVIEIIIQNVEQAIAHFDLYCSSIAGINYVVIIIWYQNIRYYQVSTLISNKINKLIKLISRIIIFPLILRFLYNYFSTSELY